MFVKNNHAKEFKLAEGIHSKILGHGGVLMAVENHFEKEAMAPNHSHFHEQVGYVAKGKFEFTINGEKEILETGDSFYIEADVPHSCVALEKGIIVDLFSPQREDFLNKVK